MNKNKYHNFSVGWVKTNKAGEEYISAVANGEKSKVKLLLELEDGTVVTPTSFVMLFNKEKQNAKSPDVRFVYSTEN